MTLTGVTLCNIQGMLCMNYNGKLDKMKKLRNDKMIVGHDTVNLL